jgi:hypothetical protein
MLPAHFLFGHNALGDRQMSGAIDWTYGPENPLVLGSCGLLTEK